MDAIVGKIVIDAPAILVPPVMLRLLASPIPDNTSFWSGVRHQIDVYLERKVYLESGLTTVFLFVGLIAQGLLMLAVARLIDARFSATIAGRLLAEPRVRVQIKPTPEGAIELSRLQTNSKREAAYRLNFLSAQLSRNDSVPHVNSLYIISQVLLGLTISFFCVSVMSMNAFAFGFRVPSHCGFSAIDPWHFGVLGSVWFACAALCAFGGYRSKKMLYEDCLNYAAMHGRASPKDIDTKR